MITITNAREQFRAELHTVCKKHLLGLSIEQRELEYLVAYNTMKAYEEIIHDAANL